MKVEAVIILLLVIITLPIIVSAGTTIPPQDTSTIYNNTNTEVEVVVHIPSKLSGQSTSKNTYGCNDIRIILVREALNNSIRIDIKGNLTPIRVLEAITCVRTIVEDTMSWSKWPSTEPPSRSHSYTITPYSTPTPLQTTRPAVSGGVQTSQLVQRSPAMITSGKTYTSNNARIAIVLLAGVIAGVLAYLLTSRW